MFWVASTDFIGVNISYISSTWRLSWIYSVIRRGLVFFTSLFSFGNIWIWLTISGLGASFRHLALGFGGFLAVEFSASYFESSFVFLPSLFISSKSKTRSFRRNNFSVFESRLSFAILISFWIFSMVSFGPRSIDGSDSYSCSVIRSVWICGGPSYAAGSKIGKHLSFGGEWICSDLGWKCSFTGEPSSSYGCNIGSGSLKPSLICGSGIRILLKSETYIWDVLTIGYSWRCFVIEEKSSSLSSSMITTPPI